jgi:hypothetical protein
MKKSTPPYIKHAEHSVIVKPTDKQNGYYYFCQQCGVWVGWLSKEEAKQMKSLETQTT